MRYFPVPALKPLECRRDILHAKKKVFGPAAFCIALLRSPRGTSIQPEVSLPECWRKTTAYPRPAQ